MATFTISLSGSSVINGSKSWTISDADVQTLINYLVANHERGDTSIQPTNAQVLVAWMQRYIDGTITKCQAWSIASQAPPPPIVFS